jgi:dephospho-CoA kinase
VDRRAVAAKVFADPASRKRLEELVHPLVAAARDRVMAEHADDQTVQAFVWDTPLLFEAGLNQQCDAVVFVDALPEERLARVASRGWDQAELSRRENLQWPLDRKRQIADYVVNNTAGADDIRDQVCKVLSLILAKTRSR